MSNSMAKPNIKNFLKTVSYTKIILCSLFLIVFGFIFGGFILTRIIRIVMKMQLQITPGTMSRDIYEKIPFPIDYTLYFFNITNPDEVMIGKKPRLQEIGPYYFEEWKTKVNIIDDEAADTMEYDFVNTLIFRPDLSGDGLTGDEFVILPHPLLLGIALSINRDRPELLEFIKVAIAGLLRNPKDIFFTGRLWDILFDGVILDCSLEDYEVSAVCSEFSGGGYKEISYINETAFTFSLFGNSNGSSIGRFKVSRGSKNIKDLGQIVQFNGEDAIDIWYEDECNQLIGTDGTIFPPFLEKEDGVKIFLPQLCRSFVADYKHPTKVAGIKTNHYEMNITASKDCYCGDTDGCLMNGAFDLFDCIGIPMILTLPHFYNADSSIMDDIESGIDPIPKKHMFYFDVYQYAGAPISAYGRLQLNVQVVPLEDLEIMRELRPMLLPFFWFEDGVDLKKKFVNMLKYQLILGLRLQTLMKVCSILCGFLGLVVGGFSAYLQKDEDVKTISVEARTESSTRGHANGVDEEKTI